VAAVPATATSELSLLPATLGLATCVHVPPDACSISVLLTPALVVWKPTAHAVPSARVATSVNSESLGNFAGRFSDHFVPFQLIASG
jgi:hypothetical protein